MIKFLTDKHFSRFDTVPLVMSGIFLNDGQYIAFVMTLIVGVIISQLLV